MRHDLEPPSKGELRADRRAARRSLDAHTQDAAARAVADRLDELGLVDGSACVAATMPADGELSPLTWIERHLRRGGRAAFPFVDDEVMRFRSVTTLEPENFRTGAFGLREPVDACPGIRLADVQLILVPLVAFDSAGRRLGRGGGFYDRSLAELDPTAERPVVVGLAHDLQEVEHVPAEAHDIALKLIVTPTRAMRA